MRRVWRIVIASLNSFSQDDGWAISSHIALSALTSLFPFLIFVGALTGLLGTPSLAENATRLIFDAWPPIVAEPIAREVDNVLTQPRTGLAAVSAFLAVYFASSGVEAVRIGLNRAYNEIDARPWWLLRIESVLFVLLGAVSLIGFTFLVVLEPLVWARAVRLFPNLVDLERLFDILRLATISLILLGTLFVSHKYLAAGRRGLCDIAPGVALTFLLWLAFGEGFGFYLARFSQTYISTYAGLASVMIALVFLYVLAAIFIVGGEVNAAIGLERKKTGAQEPPRAGD